MIRDMVVTLVSPFIYEDFRQREEMRRWGWIEGSGIHERWFHDNRVQAKGTNHRSQHHDDWSFDKKDEFEYKKSIPAMLEGLMVE